MLSKIFCKNSLLTLNPIASSIPKTLSFRTIVKISTMSFKSTFIRINKFRSILIFLTLKIFRLSMINSKRKQKLCLREMLKLTKLCRQTWRNPLKILTIIIERMKFWEGKSPKKLICFSMEINNKKIWVCQSILRIPFLIREIRSLNKSLNIINRETILF